jgi:hypothetical protein
VRHTWGEPEVGRLYRPEAGIESGLVPAITEGLELEIEIRHFALWLWNVAFKLRIKQTIATLSLNSQRNGGCACHCSMKVIQTDKQRSAPTSCLVRILGMDHVL